MKKRNQNTNTNHHLLSKSRGGKNDSSNIKRVRYKIHDAFHQVFENLTQEEIHQYLDEVWFTTKKYISPFDWLRKNPR